MNNQNASGSFSSVWGNYDKGRKKMYRRIIAAPLTLILIFSVLFTVGFASYGIMRIIDKTDYPFVNDWKVIGRWDAVDFVRKIDDFKPGEKQWGEELYLKSMAFIKNGSMLTAMGNDNLAYSGEKWTKDLVINDNEKTASKYEIKEIDGVNYMFYQWKSGDYILRNMIPRYYVLKQVDQNDYANYKVAGIEDKVDYPFVNDEQLLGKWESVDFVEKPEYYKPGEVQWTFEALYFTSFIFEENGEMVVTGDNIVREEATKSWTKGLILNKIRKTAGEYEIRELDGSQYLFFQFKNGDYIYRGMTPWYYVFKKAAD